MLKFGIPGAFFRLASVSYTRPQFYSLQYRVLPRQLIRNYALSRFPSRPVGVGRTRPGSRDKDGQNGRSRVLGESVSTESNGRTSQEESPLWQASQTITGGGGYSVEGLQRLLSNDLLVIERWDRRRANTVFVNDTTSSNRQIEMLNIFIGFEQTNKYAIRNSEGVPVGFIAEEPGGFLSSINRQLFATHRPFRALIMDTEGKPILWLRRPFAWINSRMYVQQPLDPQNTPAVENGAPLDLLDTFAEVQQVWHPFRRRYDLFLRCVWVSPVLSTSKSTNPEIECPEKPPKEYYHLPLNPNQNQNQIPPFSHNSPRWIAPFSRGVSVYRVPTERNLHLSVVNGRVLVGK
ncbi:hypothetical protein VNI00_005849 [Paramarasmius palmivorus]|uniref:Phospholipid scramblase n=1 Tax=Paramarasmius palmivorus TaxID=297713 RepID=A0AAW0DD10_9AGAR